MKHSKFALLFCAGVLLLALNACDPAPSEKTANASPSASVSPIASASPSLTSATNPQGAADVVSAGASEAKVAAGAKGMAEIRLHIADGYHVNANPASDKFYIPTQLEVASSEGIKTGAPAYPASVSKKFAFTDKPLAVYEREAVIKLPLNADAAATKGAHALHGTLRVQPCNEETCLPPRTLQTIINVTVE